MLLLLVAASCSDTDTADSDAVPPTAAAPSDRNQVVTGPDTSYDNGPTRPDTEITIAESPSCGGIGPATATGTVTWVSDGRLWESSGQGDPTCLFELGGAVRSLAWSHRGDRLLINDHIILGGPADRKVLPGVRRAEFTSPNGDNLIWIDDDGKLHKYLARLDEAAELPALSHHTAVAYHPGGGSFAAAGRAEDAGEPSPNRAYLIDADGQNITPLTGITTGGVAVTDVRFSSDGRLLYLTVSSEAGSDRIVGLAMTPANSDDNPQPTAGPTSRVFTVADSSEAISALRSHPTEPLIVGFSTGDCANGYNFEVATVEEVASPGDTSSDTGTDGGSSSAPPPDSTPVSEPPSNRRTLLTGDGALVGLLDAEQLSTVAFVLTAPCGADASLEVVAQSANGATESSEVDDQVEVAAVRVARGEVAALPDRPDTPDLAPVDLPVLG